MTKQNIAETIALELAQESAKVDPLEAVLSTGVILRANPVSNWLMLDINKRYKEPKIPMWYNEENGRDEENPNHPDYLAAMQEYQENVTMVLLNTYILMGTTVVSVPDGFPKPEDGDWMDELRLLGIEVTDTRKGRYLAWVKYIAAPHEADTTKIMTAVARASGTAEEDVDQAAKSFRDQAGE